MVHVLKCIGLDGTMMPRLLLMLPLAMLTLLISGRLDAAQITTTHAGNRQGIVLTGDLASSDVERFEMLTRKFKPGDFVSLSSAGGSTFAGIKIGRLVRSRQLATVVTSRATCTSACALIWVAGTTRIMSAGARIGFHASYFEDRGQKVEIGFGNAMVGRYLTLLGLPERAVIFATLAGPDEIAWLKPDERQQHGIDFELVETERPPRQTTNATSSFKVIRGKWTIYGENGNCLASLGSEDGTSLDIGFDAELAKPLYLSLSNKSWRSIIKDRPYNIELALGLKVVDFKANGNATPGISGYVDKELVATLLASKVLTANLGSRRLGEFDLTGIENAWSSLRHCAVTTAAG